MTHPRKNYANLATVMLDGVTVDVAMTKEVRVARNGSRYRCVRLKIKDVHYHGAAFQRGPRLAFDMEVHNTWPQRITSAALRLRGSVTYSGDLDPISRSIALTLDDPIPKKKRPQPSARQAEEGQDRDDAARKARAGERAAQDRRERADKARRRATFEEELWKFIIGEPAETKPKRRFSDPVQQEAWDSVPTRFSDRAEARRVKIKVNVLLLGGAAADGPHKTLLQELNATIDDMSKSLIKGQRTRQAVET